MGARWDDPAQEGYLWAAYERRDWREWEQEINTYRYAPHGPGRLLRGLLVAALIQLLFVALVLLVVVAGRAVADVSWHLPPIYTQCVGNGHVSDLCLGA